MMAILSNSCTNCSTQSLVQTAVAESRAKPRSAKEGSDERIGRGEINGMVQERGLAPSQSTANAGNNACWRGACPRF